MPAKPYDPATFTATATQSTAQWVVQIAIAGFLTLPTPSRTPEVFTKLVVKGLLNAFPDDKDTILDDAEWFLTTHGIYIFGHPHYVSFPIVAVENNCQLTDYSDETAARSILDKSGRAIVFTQVSLGRPFQNLLRPEHQGRATDVRGAYSRGSMFVVPSAFDEEARARWTYARRLIALFSIGIEEHHVAVDLLLRVPPPRDPALYLLCHHLCRTIIASGQPYDAQADEAPSTFLSWCATDMTQQLRYHEIAGHYVHDLMRDQRGQWPPQLVPLAEARAQLCEVTYSPNPLIGLYELFGRSANQQSKALSLLVPRLRTITSSARPADLSSDIRTMAIVLSGFCNRRLRSLAAEALEELDRSFS